MRIAVVREALATDPLPLETRVAATPDSIKRLKALGFEISVESGAGEAANFPDSLYVEAGATIAVDACTFVPPTRASRRATASLRAPSCVVVTVEH